MSITYDLYCEDCGEAVWCGQAAKSAPGGHLGYVYTAHPKVLYAMGRFTEQHCNHTLRFASEYCHEDVVAKHESDVLTQEEHEWVPEQWADAWKSWRPIASAPRTGRMVWVYMPGVDYDESQFIAWFAEGDWLTRGNLVVAPTHWMPIPEPPSEVEE